MGIAQQAVWRCWRRWQRWRCLVADSRGRSRTEHRVARVSAPIEFGARGLLVGSCWPSLRRARHLTSGHDWAAPDCTSCPGSPPFPKCRVQAWGRRRMRRGDHSDSAPKVTVSYYYMSHPAVLLLSHSPSPRYPENPPLNLFSWTPNAAADLVMPRPGTAIARFYPCTPPS